MDEVKVLQVKQSVFAANDRQADQLRAQLKKKGIFLLNLMSSPGSGESTKCLNVRAGLPLQGASVPNAARVASISASQAQASLASSPSAPASRSS